MKDKKKFTRSQVRTLLWNVYVEKMPPMPVSTITDHIFPAFEKWYIEQLKMVGDD